MSAAVGRRTTLLDVAAAALAETPNQGASGTRRALQEWVAAERSADADTLSDLPTLRARSRDLVRNEPLAASAVNTNVTSVIGTGLRVQPLINRRVLGMTEEQADEWEMQARDIFNLVKDQLDIARGQTFAEMLDLAFRSPLESGDCFALRRYRKNPGDILGLKVQLIEADRVCNINHGQDTELLRGGIEHDSDGAPVRYHIADRHPGDLYSFGLTKWHLVPAFGRSGERQVIHIIARKRVGQTRGLPYLAPAIEPLKQYSRLKEAELMGALISAMLTVFIETSAGHQSDELFAPVPETGVGLVSGKEETNRYKLESGSAVELLEGEKPHIVSSNRPNPAFEAFIDAIVRHMGAGLEIPFEVLVKHFRASYSASRAALLEAWRYFLRRRKWIAAAFCAPVYEWVLVEAISRGMLDAPGFFEDPLLRRAWLGAVWIGDSAGQIDPKKEAEAAVIRIDNGFSNLEMEVPSLTGADWEDVHEQRVKEIEKRAPMPSPAPAAQAEPAREPGPDDVDLEDEER